MTSTSTKRCGRCETSKPVEEFGSNRSTKDGRQSYCRECIRAYRAGRGARTREQVAAAAEARRARAEVKQAAFEARRKAVRDRLAARPQSEVDAEVARATVAALTADRR